MSDHVSTLRIDLTGNLSPEAKAMGDAMLRAAADAKKLDEALAQSGASDKMQARLKALGASVTHIDAATAALKAYRSAEDAAAGGGEWTRAQINGMKSVEQTTIAVVRNKILEEKKAHAQVMSDQREEIAEAKRLANAQIAEQKRVAESMEREARREANSRARMRERELADERRHHERILEQRLEAQKRMGFGHYVAGGVVAGVSAHGVVSGIERAAEAGSELQDTRLTLQRAGIDAAMRAQMEKQALDLSRRFGNVGQVAIMDLQKEARSVLKDEHEVFAVTETLAKAKSVLDAGGGHSEGLGQLVKGAESIGAAQDPERLTRLIDAYVKAIQVMGKTINPEQIYQFDKYAKTAGATMSDRFLMTTGLSLSQEMGGSTAANDIFHAQKDIVGGFQNKHIPIQELVKLGVIAPGDVRRLHGTGQAMGLKAGRNVQDSQLAQTDLDLWVYKVLLPALEAHGMKTEMTQLAEISKIFTGGEADVISKLITQRGSFENHAVLYGKAAGLDGQGLNAQSATAGVAALGDALVNLAGNATVSLMAPAAKVLFTVADGLNALAQAAAANPTLASGAFLAGGAGALYGAGKLGQMVMNGFSGFGGAAAAVQETAANTQVTAGELQMRAAGIEAEAATKNAATGGSGAKGGGMVETVAKALMLYEATKAAKEAHALDAPTRGGLAGAVEFLDPGLADRIYGRNLPESRTKDDIYASPRTSTLSADSYWRRKNAYLHRSAYTSGDEVGSSGFLPISLRADEGVERGPVEAGGADARLEMAVAAGTEAGVLAAYAKMKGDGSASGAGGFMNASLGGGDLGGMSGDSGSGGGGGGRAPSVRYGRQHSSSPYIEAGAGAGGAAVHDTLKDLIALHEVGTTGAGGYDTAYGHAERGGRFAPPKPISQMTIAEVLAYQRKMKPLAGSPAFPVGRAQWTESTLRGLTRGMDPNTVFSPDVQEKLFDRSIAGRMGQGVGGFRSEWDSLRGVGSAEIQNAISGHRAGLAPSGGVGAGYAGKGDAVSIAGSLLGQREAGASKALGHVMHAGEWCADFVNGTIEKAGGRGSGSAMASSFMNWGKAVAIADAKRGDVIMENSGRGTRVHHAGLVESVDRDKQGKVTGIHMISGNYGHMVKRNLEPFGIIGGLRRANDAPVVPRTGPRVPNGPRTEAMMEGGLGIFDHDNAHRTLQTVRQIRQEVARLGDASVSVLSGPRGGNRGKARGDVGRKLRGAPASNGTSVA